MTTAGQTIQIEQIGMVLLPLSYKTMIELQNIV